MGFEDDNDPRFERRPRRDLYGESEDAWGAADAEDYYDSGSAEDLSIDQHASGLDYDPTYDNPSAPRLGGASDRVSNRSWSDAPLSGAPGSDLPFRAQGLQDRIQRVQQRGVRTNRDYDGRPAEAGKAERERPALPCAVNTTVILGVLFVMLIVVSIMAFLASRALIRLLGI
jgi:hypothetical protein